MFRSVVSRTSSEMCVGLVFAFKPPTYNPCSQQTELLDAFTETNTATAIVDATALHTEDIGFGRANFSWSNETTDGSVTPSRQTFRLRIEDEVTFKRGKFNLIIGMYRSSMSRDA